MATGRAASRARRARSKSRRSSSGSSRTTRTSRGNETVDQTVARAKAMLDSAYNPNTKRPSRSRMDEIANQDFVTKENRDAYYASRPITPESMQPTQVTEIPTKPVPVTQGLDLNLNNAALGAGSDGMFQIGAQAGDSESVTAAKDASNVIGGYLEQAMGLARPEEGASERALEEARRQAGVEEAQREFNRYSNQINAITAQRDAAQLSLEGQGRGITDTIIGGQQARIGREAAIQALPVQAQLAAAQGNLEQAQQLMGQLYQAKSADIQADQTYRTSLANSVMQWANSSQQAILQAKQADIAQRAQTAQSNLAFQRQLGMQALEFGQNGLITGIAEIDPNSPTFEQDIAAFTSRLQKPVTTGAAKSEWEIKDINGTSMWVNKFTQETKPVEGGAAAGEEVQNTLANFDFLRNAASQVMELSEGASPNPTAEFLRRNLGSSATKNTQLQGYVDTLKANMLTLATDPSIKQFFGPQMSDADVRLMTAAGSNLRPDEQTPTQLRQEVERIDDWINRAQTAVREGAKGNNFAPNTITAPDGTLIEIID